VSAYQVLLTIHVSCAFISISGFMLRYYWKIKHPALLRHRLVKVLPHVIDTLFLLSAIGLLSVLSFGLLNQGWLMHKIGLLAVYIVLGMIALGNKYTKRRRLIAFIAAVLVFIYILGIAFTKTALSWLLYLF
tara:strand:- start:22682 stop:23077 length:396 start_codon:yes stop_codon:yes gene_type:complete